jgi:hypothetical protein
MALEVYRTAVSQSHATNCRLYRLASLRFPTFWLRSFGLRIAVVKKEMIAAIDRELTPNFGDGRDQAAA